MPYLQGQDSSSKEFKIDHKGLDLWQVLRTAIDHGIRIYDTLHTSESLAL